MNLLWLSYSHRLATASWLASCLELSQLSWVPWPGWGFAHEPDSRAAGMRFSSHATVAPFASLQMNLRLCDLQLLRCLRGFSIKWFIGLRVQQVSNPLSRRTRPVLDLSMVWPCSGSDAS